MTHISNKPPVPENPLPPGFRMARYHFCLRLENPWHPHGWLGVLLRGAFGAQFRRLCCVTQSPDCSTCLLRSQCAYLYVFETAPAPGAERLRNLESIPRPFVFEPEPGANAAELRFHLVLVGRAIAYLPYFVLTFVEIGRHGLGKERVPFQVESVTVETPGQPDPVPIYTGDDGALRDHRAQFDPECFARRAAAFPQNGPLTCRFLTPTRLRQAGEILKEVTFRDFFGAVLRRLSALSYFHCDAELALDFRDLLRQAEAVSVTARDLRWVPLERFSRRQQQTVKLGGFTGTLTFAGDLAPFLPLLAAGELAHVGKACVMGLGRYRLEDAP